MTTSTDTQIVFFLKNIIKTIEDGTIDPKRRERIHNLCFQYIVDNSDSKALDMDPEMVKYLFLGFWIYMNKTEEVDSEEE